LVAPARHRNIKIGARILEGSGKAIENFDLVRTVDVYGNRGSKACRSHPDCRGFWNGVVADLFQAGGPKPPEGVYTVFLRHIIRYPEILSWQYQYRLSRAYIHRGMYATIKAIKPSAFVGATGIMVSREYEEMRIPHLGAGGRAVRDWH
jgi:hypothetical protein